MQGNFYYQYYYWKKQDDFRKLNRSEIKKWGLLSGICVLAYIMLSNVINTLIMITPFYEIYRESDIAQNAVGILISVIAIFLPFFVLSLSYKKMTVLKSISFSKPKSQKYFWFLVVGGFAFCILANFVASWISALFSLVGLTPVSGAAEVSPETTFWGFILCALRIAVVPALVEEFAVRGVLMQPLRKYGDGFAIITSALIFAVMHGNFVQGTFAFIVGVALGYVAVATNSIWTGVLIHFINNMFSVAVSGFSLISIAVSNIFYWLIAIPTIVFGIIFIIKYFKSGKAYRLKKPQTYLSGGQKLRAFISTPTIIISLVFLGLTAIISMV